MAVRRGPETILILGFVVILAAPGLLQLADERQRDEPPAVLEVFSRAPTASNLHAYERDLEESNVLVRRLRPRVQQFLYQYLGDAGEKAVLGREDWLFYRPGVRYLVERTAAPAHESGPSPLEAIRSLRDQLADRGIRLVLVPIPNKESVYPEKLSARAEGQGGLIGPATDALLRQLRAADIEFVDLFERFQGVREGQGEAEPGPIYLTQDSHWTPQGAALAAAMVARHLRERGVAPGSTRYDERIVPLSRLGDVLKMLQVPRLEETIAPELLSCRQVVRHDTGEPYQDDPNARILVLGDSFLRIFERDEPGAAGFLAHLARELSQPLTSIVNDGGASTMVRQELARRPRLLRNKTVVIWEFVERDIRDGAEGWKIIRIPALPE